MEKHVYFVRHGESEENATRVHIGASASLTEEGKRQAAIVAERMERIGVEAIITSPYLRAQDTALSIGTRIGLDVGKSALLAEWLEPSEVIGLHADDPARKDVREAIAAAAHDHDYRHSDEETFSELVVRAHKALAMLEARPEERICVVTHGGFLRIMLGVMVFGPHFTKREFADMLKHLHTTNTGITYAHYDPDGHGWRLVTWNDQAHFG